jgi:hypothetical protein
MKIMLNSPSRHLVRLHRKLKVPEKVKVDLFVSYYCILQYSNVLVICQFQWLI